MGVREPELAMKPTLGPGMTIDLPRLLETRMLVQANSGYGKSWALRRILEQTAGKVPQLVIDPEGEFATLREKFDYVIAAPHDGDAVAHPRTAGLLARRLLETGVSAILDIYDLKAHERHSFVRQFLEAVVNAPKALWQPTLIFLDEASVFCPEQGSSEASGAVIDLATRGRKRGFCLIAAVQRLSKIDKDAAAELLNKMIGRAGLDVDVKRAADELGMTMKNAWEAMRALTPGEFYAFGPALSATVEKVKVGDVQTTHPKAGSRTLRAPPKPTAAIVAVLPKLADLPKEAEQEARTAEDLRRELAAARRELTMAKRSQPQPTQAAPSKKDIEAAERRGWERAITATHQQLGEVVDGLRHVMASEFATLSSALNLRVFDRTVYPKPPRFTPGQDVKPDTTIMTAAEVLKRQQEYRVPQSFIPAKEHQRTDRPGIRPGNGRLPPGERAVLQACIQYPAGLERSQLTVLTAYKRSSRDAYIARLKEKGYVTTDGDRVIATGEGMAALPDAEPLPTGPELREFWNRKLPDGERKILEILCAAYPDAVARADLDEQTGYMRSSRDAYLARLRAKQLVAEPSRGMVRATGVLFQ